MVQFGFGAVPRTLLAAGVLDRIRLWLHPVLIGRGGPADLLYQELPTTPCALEQCTPLESGIVILDYRITAMG